MWLDGTLNVKADVTSLFRLKDQTIGLIQCKANDTPNPKFFLLLSYILKTLGSGTNNDSDFQKCFKNINMPPMLILPFKEKWIFHREILFEQKVIIKMVFFHSKVFRFLIVERKLHCKIMPPVIMLNKLFWTQMFIGTLFIIHTKYFC